MYVCDDYAYYGSRMDGAMAEYIKVSASNILPLPINVDFEEGLSYRSCFCSPPCNKKDRS